VLLRGTTADADGNISMEEEAFHSDVLALAQAARNCGGIVIVQAKRLAERHAIHPHSVRVPGILVDYVVVAERPEDHWQTFGEEYKPAYVGAVRAAPRDAKRLPLDLRKIVRRRAVLELLKYRRPIVNRGVGMSAGVGEVAREEGLEDFVMTLESGPIGGTPAQYPSFGASANPDAVVSHGEQFDFYDGGGRAPAHPARWGGAEGGAAGGAPLVQRRLLHGQRHQGPLHHRARGVRDARGSPDGDRDRAGRRGGGGPEADGCTHLSRATHAAARLKAPQAASA
jgi:hypothetical protein